MIIRLFGLLLGLAFIAVPSISRATADGPDFWRVTGVEQGDVLNMRAEPMARAALVGTIPPDGNGLANFGCVGELSLAEFQRASEDERKAAAKRRWCKVAYRQHIAWVAGRFLAEGDRPLSGSGGRIIELEGSEWGIIHFAGQSADAEAWIAFYGQNRLGGNGSCNAFKATFVQRGSDILIGDLASTRKACGSVKTEVEQTLFDVLARARSVAAHHLVMALFDRNNRLLVTFLRRDAD